MFSSFSLIRRLLNELQLCAKDEESQSIVSTDEESQK